MPKEGRAPSVARRAWISALWFESGEAERGVTVLEYAFIAGLISIAAAGVLYLIGTDLTAAFQSFADAFS